MKEVRVVEEQVEDTENLRIGRLKELSETERLERSAAEVCQIEALKPEVWSGLAETDRERCLYQVGSKLSEAYECPAPPFIGCKMAEVEGGILLGAYSDSNYITKLNHTLLQMNESGVALETFAHEFRHAYQHEMVERYQSAFRHLCHDETAAARWAENLDGRYVEFGTDPEGYKDQAVESDARTFAASLRAEVERRQISRGPSA